MDKRKSFVFPRQYGNCFSRSGAQKLTNPSRESISILSDKCKGHTFVHPVISTLDSFNHLALWYFSCTTHRPKFDKKIKKIWHLDQ